MNAILEDGYEVKDDKLTSPYNKTRARGDTDQPIYKEVWACNDIYHRRTA